MVKKRKEKRKEKTQPRAKNSRKEKDAENVRCCPLNQKGGYPCFFAPGMIDPDDQSDISVSKVDP